MRILTRTCIAEASRLFAFYTVIFSLVAILATGGPLLNKGAPLSAVFGFIPLQLALFSPYIIPLALSTAILNVLGRMDDAGELIALRAVGISSWSIIRGLLPFIIGIALLMSVLRVIAIPHIAHRVLTGKSTLVSQAIATKIARKEPIWKSSDHKQAIIALDANGAHIKHIITYTSDDHSHQFMYAPTGQWASTQDLHLMCNDVRYWDIQLPSSAETVPQVTTAFISRLNKSIPLDTQQTSVAHKPALKSLSDIQTFIGVKQRAIDDITAHAAYDPDGTVLLWHRYNLRKHQFEWHLRIIAPFSICVYFICACAIALSLRINNKLIAGVLGVAIIVVNILPSIIAIQGFAKHLPVTPGFFLWTPLLTTALCGSYILWKKC